MKINNVYFMMILMMSWNSMRTMEAGGDIVMDDAMRHYEEGDLLDPDRTKLTEVFRVIDQHKKKILMHSLFSSIGGGLLFNQLTIPQIAENEKSNVFKWIKEHPIKSSAIVGTVSGVVGGVCTVSHYAAQRGAKREQLETIKNLEREKENIENDPDLNDIVRGIRIDHAQELLDKAIRKYNGI